MAKRLKANPNRMELNRLKKRLKTAEKGYDLLKNKQDEMMRQYIDLVKRNDELRKEVEKELDIVYKSFSLASALTSPAAIEEALMLPKQTVGVEVSTRTIMTVEVPIMEFTFDDADTTDIYPYGIGSTTSELDAAMEALHAVLPKLLKLGEIEKTCNLLTDEIEKTRRRVNALEYMTIPRLEETIRYIHMKLDENERANLVRLMKVKEMMVEEEERAIAEREKIR